jgi:hypothetical protein
MEEVGFGLTEVDLNKESQFWPNWNGKSWVWPNRNGMAWNGRS